MSAASASPVPSTGSRESAADYMALRGGVGAVPLARDVIRVSGPDAVEYLQGQCSQDVEALEIVGSADALLLTPQGKLDALVRVSRVAEDEFYVDVDAGYGTAVLTRLARFKLRVKVDIEPVEWHAVALRGPEAATLLDTVTSQPGTAFVVPYAWGGVTGLDLVGPKPEVPANVRSCQPEAWQTLRVEAGIPAMGAELDEKTIAAEAGLLERCVSFTKGCYTGQELVARLDARGNKVARRLRGVVIDPDTDPGATFEPGAVVVMGEKTVGRLTTVAWSPGLRATAALGYLHRDVDPPCAVQVQRTVGEFASAQVLALPLVV